MRAGGVDTSAGVAETESIERGGGAETAAGTAARRQPAGDGRGAGWVGGQFCVQAEAGMRDVAVTGVQTCALPISAAVFRIDESIEVGAIENQTVPIQVAGLQQPLSESLANGRDLFFSEEFHVVPEARCGEL